MTSPQMDQRFENTLQCFATHILNRMPARVGWRLVVRAAEILCQTTEFRSSRSKDVPGFARETVNFIDVADVMSIKDKTWLLCWRKDNADSLVLR